MKFIPLFLLFFVSSVLAQERLILNCNVEIVSEFIARGTLDVEKNNESIQIDVERYPKRFGFKEWIIVRIQGSRLIDEVFGSPPAGKFYKYQNGEWVRNRSDSEKYGFYVTKNGMRSPKMPDSLSLEIDRVTGLVNGYVSKHYPEVWLHREFTGVCKKFKKEKKLF